jgi:hypothetical protein
MKRCGLGCIALGAFLFHGNIAHAQSAMMKALQDELNQAKLKHQQATSLMLSNFFSQVNTAMASTDGAIDLYVKAGGTIPDPSPVLTLHENESASEKEARLALDQENLTGIGTVLMLHCGMLHYAAMFALYPDQKGLQADWVTWLKRAAQVYPLVTGPAQPPPPPPPRKKSEHDHEFQHNPGPPVLQRPAPYNLSELREKTMRGSIIGKFLEFKYWGDKEQAGWAVKDIPKLYFDNVLTPLRVTPSPATLAAWDVYISLANAEEKDNDKWTNDVFPPLQFERAVDAYQVTPSTEKLEVLVNLIAANPTNPATTDWTARVQDLINGYGAHRSGGVTPNLAPAVRVAPTPGGTPGAPTPAVTTTTVQQGDMTIITTHTNAAPVNAPPVR